jgi:hypothetical protein
MKSMSLCLLTILLSGLVFGQTETFDIATYTPSKDFKKETKQGVVTYTHVNTTTGTFCVIDMAIVLCIKDPAGLYFPFNAVKEQQLMMDKQQQQIDKFKKLAGQLIK